MKRPPRSLTPDDRRGIVEKALREEYGHTEFTFEVLTDKQIVVHAGGHRFILLPFPTAEGKWTGAREMPAGRGLTATTQISLAVELGEIPG